MFGWVGSESKTKINTLWVLKHYISGTKFSSRIFFFQLNHLMTLSLSLWAFFSDDYLVIKKKWNWSVPTGCSLLSWSLHQVASESWTLVDEAYCQNGVQMMLQQGQQQQKWGRLSIATKIFFPMFLYVWEHVFKLCFYFSTRHKLRNANCFVVTGLW